MTEIIVKCGYKHCQHESRELLRDSATKIKSIYFHEDCAITKITINKIKELYCKSVDKDVSIPQLLGVINNIVFKKGINAQFLLFGLEYWIKKNVKISNPYVLHYIKDNKIVANAWKVKNKKIGGDSNLC